MGWQIISLPLSSWRRPRCVAKWGRSSLIAPLRNGRKSTSTLSQNSIKPLSPGGLKSCATRLKHHTPADVLAAMEKQMRAEREKRAVILTSEGERDAVINAAEGDKQQVIKGSEASNSRSMKPKALPRPFWPLPRPRLRVCARLPSPCRSREGMKVQLRVAEQYITQFGALAKASTTMILPASVSDIGAMIAAAMNVITQAAPASTSAPSEPPLSLR